jgi:hypothetical protein
VCLEPAADGAGSSTPAGWFCGGLDEAGDLVIGLSGFSSSSGCSRGGAGLDGRGAAGCDGVVGPGVLLDRFWVTRRLDVFDQRCR